MSGGTRSGRRGGDAELRALLRIVRELRARRVVEVGHGRNLRYLSFLRERGVDVVGVEVRVEHVRRALDRGLPSVNADAVGASGWVKRALRPDLVYAVRPPVELALDLLREYSPVALRVRWEERGELPEPARRLGPWDLYV
ncbi:MAG: UPF0146 family protein [Euryarchaeota archaeon]